MVNSELLSRDDVTKQLDPMAVSVLLHAYTGHAICHSQRVEQAVEYLLSKGIIYNTQDNFGCPYGNSGVAHDLVLQILAMPWPP